MSLNLSLRALRLGEKKKNLMIRVTLVTRETYGLKVHSR
jgi:hypothetical protein